MVQVLFGNNYTLQALFIILVPVTFWMWTGNGLSHEAVPFIRNDKFTSSQGYCQETVLGNQGMDDSALDDQEMLGIAIGTRRI